ncbi:MAG: hypothetical protein NT113_12920, partial [Hyphomicrobiales bacterium]|nr:hypothetical protein [Hyphomicrobiales bacterium]
MASFTNIVLPWVLASGLMLFKLKAALDVAKWLKCRLQLDFIAVFVVGWITVLILQTAIILLLSLPGFLSRPALIASLGISFLLIHLQARSLPRLDFSAAARGIYRAPAAVFALIVAVLWLRSALIFDSTWDGQVYGLPRLILWMQAKTVFLHLDLPQINIVANEWNAELGMLAYALWSGSYVGFNFANLEFFIVLVVGIFWVASLLGMPRFWSQCVAVAFSCAPALIGLVVVAKGDLLACVAICLAFGWLLPIRRLESP